MGSVVQLPERYVVPPMVREIRPRSVARRRLQKLLKYPEFLIFWRHADRMPLGARLVLEAAVDLVALCGDGCEYHVHPRDMANGGVAKRLGGHLQFHLGEAEIRQHVTTLVGLGMLKVRGNVLRLGDC